MAANRGFGIDIGGSGIKGCVVDLDSGELVGERIRIVTPQPSTPDAVADVVAEIVSDFGWDGPVGVTLPCVIKKGTALTAANVDKKWIGTDAAALFAKRLNRPAEQVVVLNDADAAGLAEMRFGHGAGRSGVVVLLTFGTGIGSALFLDGVLVPNTEFGHLELNGADAELHASDRIREEQDLHWEKWAGRVQDYLQVVERLLSPDLIIIGGGVSKKADRFLPYVKVNTPVVPAVLQNNAGIVGAAMATTSQL
jgi:polyphosphate glucokinase